MKSFKTVLNYVVVANLGFILIGCGDGDKGPRNDRHIVYTCTTVSTVENNTQKQIVSVVAEEGSLEKQTTLFESKEQNKKFTISLYLPLDSDIVEYNIETYEYTGSDWSHVSSNEASAGQDDDIISSSVITSDSKVVGEESVSCVNKGVAKKDDSAQKDKENK